MASARGLHGPTLAPGGEPIGDVLRHAHMREQRVVLEYDTDLAAVRRQRVDGAIADNDLAAALLDEAGDDPEQGGLAATGRAEQRDQFAPLDLQSHVVDREPRAVTVSDAVKRKRLGSHRNVISTLEHGMGTISRSFLDKIASNYRANADGKDAVRRMREHGSRHSRRIEPIALSTSKCSPTPHAAWRQTLSRLSIGFGRGEPMARDIDATGHEHIIAVLVECR
jgi:hypothetical protein